VRVTGGTVTVGLNVDGNAGQWLRADDITLTPVDGSELSDAIRGGETLEPSDYSSRTWSTLTDALNAAKEVDADIFSTQAIIDETATALRRAHQALESAVIGVEATTTKTLYAVGEPFAVNDTSVTATRADGTASLLATSDYILENFDTGTTAEVSLTFHVNPELTPVGSEPISTALNVSVLRGWSPNATYIMDDAVVYNGSKWTATWWTRDQIPGDPSGPWQEIAEAPDGTASWTPSRIFVLGDVIEHEGTRYTAQWWTRNQEPGDPHGPWASNT
jgi:chitodextrinase